MYCNLQNIFDFFVTLNLKQFRMDFKAANGVAIFQTLLTVAVFPHEFINFNNVTMHTEIRAANMKEKL